MAKVEELVIHCNTSEVEEKLDKVQIKLEQILFLVRQIEKSGIKKKNINKILMNKIILKEYTGEEQWVYLL